MLSFFWVNVELILFFQSEGGEGGMVVSFVGFVIVVVFVFVITGVAVVFYFVCVTAVISVAV